MTQLRLSAGSANLVVARSDRPETSEPQFGQAHRPIVLDVWEKIRRHPLIVGCTTAAGMVLAIAFVFLFPRYTAEAVLSVDTQRNDWTRMSSPVPDVPDDHGMILALAWSETERMQSWPIALRVADALQLQKDPRYSAHGHFIRGIMARVRGWVLNQPDNSIPIVGSDVDKQSIDPDRIELAEHVLGGLRVSSDHNTGLIQMRYTTDSPILSAIILSKWVEVTIADQVEEKDRELQQARQWVDGQLQELQDQVARSDRAVQEYKATFKLVPVAQGATLAQLQVSQFDQQLTSSMGELASLQARIQFLDAAKNSNRKDGTDALARSPDAMESRVIQELRISYVENRSILEQLQSTYGSQHPKLIAQRAALSGIQDSINRELDRIKGSLSGQSSMLQKRIEAIRAQTGSAVRELDTQTLAEGRLRQLEADATTNRDVYNSFLLHSRELITLLNIQKPTNIVLTPSRIPVSPRHSNTLVVGLAGLFCFGIGCVLALLMDALDTGFSSTDEMKKSGAHMIGMLPEISASKEARSLFAEMIHQVCVGLYPFPKVVLVTSSVSGEGKTTTAACIAKALAGYGKRVVLVDCDLTRPKIHDYFSLQNDVGLRELLAGKAGLPAATLKQVSPGIDVICAGSYQARRALVGSQMFQDLLAALKQNYDYVVLDSAPVLMVADTLVIAKYADRVLFPVRWRNTQKHSVVSALELLEEQEAPVSCVLSRVDIRKYARYDSLEARRYLSYWRVQQDA